MSALLTVAQFADLAGISRQKAWRAAQRCHEGGRWRGVQLSVLVDRKGDKKLYLIDPRTLPGELASKPRALAVTAAPCATDQNASNLSLGPGQQLRPWMLDAVRAVRQAGPPNSQARGAATKAIAATLRYPEGKKRGKPVSPRTIREWVRKYEEGGYGALARRPRADAGSSRVVISRQWDRAADAAGLSADERKAVLDQVQEAVKQQIKAGCSYEVAQFNVIPELVRASQKAGMDVPDNQLVQLCKVPLERIKRFAPIRAAFIYRKDAGRSAAIQTPRIRRDRSHLRPMEFVAGDVHHIDIAFRRADGSLCTVKAIAWQDLATNRVFVTPVLLPQGRAVRREHILQSFAAMCADPNWGVPTRLYLDNGSEYSLLDELTRDLFALKQMCGQEVEVFHINDLEPGTQKARPYNPQAKVIETVFAGLEKTAFAQLPGHIGGDRMKKKTENQGKAPVPYNGDFDGFTEDLQEALNWHHRKPQKGHLKGKSPNERFAEFIGAGWKSVTLHPEQLEIAFSKTESRCVTAGGEISVGGQYYRHDELLRYSGTGRVTVRVPLIGDKERVYVFDAEDAFICTATPAPTFQFGDPEGAKEQRRQDKEFRRQMAEYGQVPRDNRAAMRAVVDMMPEPQAPSSGRISINEEFREAARSAASVPKQVSAPSRQQQLQDKALKRLTGDWRKRAAGE